MLLVFDVVENTICLLFFWLTSFRELDASPGLDYCLFYLSFVIGELSFFLTALSLLFFRFFSKSNYLLTSDRA